MTVTSSDVARLAGVSRPAVSQILNGHGDRFLPATRDRVLQAARDLNYQPSAAARALRRGTSEIVVALIPYTTWGRNLQDLVDTWTDGLSALGLTLVLRFSHSSPESFDHLVRTMHPLAVLTLARVSADDRRLLHECGVHLVEPSTGQVEHFDEAIGRTQAEHLIARGYTRLAYARLHDTRQDPFGHAREEGFRNACRAHDLPTPASLSLAIDTDQARAQLAGLRLPGYGIACYNDDVALALLSAARRLGWEIPNDLALIGMDNTPHSTLADPQLTTVDADLRVAGLAMVATVQRELYGSPTANPVTESPVVPHVIERGTT